MPARADRPPPPMACHAVHPPPPGTARLPLSPPCAAVRSRPEVCLPVGGPVLRDLQERRRVRTVHRRLLCQRQRQGERFVRSDARAAPLDHTRRCCRRRRRRLASGATAATWRAAPQPLSCPSHRLRAPPAPAPGLQCARIPPVIRDCFIGDPYCTRCATKAKCATCLAGFSVAATGRVRWPCCGAAVCAAAAVPCAGHAAVPPACRATRCVPLTVCCGGAQGGRGAGSRCAAAQLGVRQAWRRHLHCLHRLQVHPRA